MTASTLANALQIGNNKSYLPSLAILIVKVFRSQFIAFVGNLVFAFPVAFLISSFFGIILGVDIFTELDAEELKQDLMPFQSLTFFYAAIAGVYLFLAGIISGYYDNSVLYNNIPKRVEYHPVLSVVLGRKLSRKLANYISHNLGSLVGNFSLGVMLGTAAAIGQILGLPYDIRHITFTTAQFGFAYYAHPFIFDFKTVLFCIFTILGIGFFNFAISFGLAFYTATRARFITFKEANTLFKLLIKYFYKYPFDFLFPPKKERVERDLV
jgi:site-specific recombinase